MTENTHHKRALHDRAARPVLWAVATLVFLLPLMAMQFTSEVNWNLADFLVFGAMLAGACGTCELAARRSRNNAFRAAVAVAVAAAFLLLWINLAVGIIGEAGNTANLMFGGVLAVGIVGGLIVRFQPRAMVWVLLATALAQGIAAPVALLIGSGKAFVLAAGFVPLWLASAWLFRKAARERHPGAN